MSPDPHGTHAEEVSFHPTSPITANRSSKYLHFNSADMYTSTPHLSIPLKLNNCIPLPLPPEFQLSLRTSQLRHYRYIRTRVPNTSPSGLTAKGGKHERRGEGEKEMGKLTSVTKAQYPTNAGKATTYANERNAVRFVQRKYLCRFTIMSAGVSTTQSSFSRQLFYRRYSVAGPAMSQPRGEGCGGTHCCT